VLLNHRQLHDILYCLDITVVRNTTMWLLVFSGTHKVDVTYEGLNVPRSPFSVNVVPGCDPSRVRAFGPGISHLKLAVHL